MNRHLDLVISYYYITSYFEIRSRNGRRSRGFKQRDKNLERVPRSVISRGLEESARFSGYGPAIPDVSLKNTIYNGNRSLERAIHYQIKHARVFFHLRSKGRLARIALSDLSSCVLAVSCSRIAAVTGHN